MNGTPAGHQRGNGAQEQQQEHQQDTAREHSFARTTGHARHGHGTRNTFVVDKPGILPTSDLLCYGLGLRLSSAFRVVIWCCKYVAHKRAARHVRQERGWALQRKSHLEVCCPRTREPRAFATTRFLRSMLSATHSCFAQVTTLCDSPCRLGSQNFTVKC